MPMLNIQQRHPAPVPSELIYACHGNETLARILAGRGVLDIDTLDLNISGLLPATGLLGLEQAVATIDAAIDTGKRLLVVGDFDCDGATSTALMMRVLTALGATVDFLVPDRFRFGYGLTPKLAEHAKAVFSPDLIITVDNGISSHEGVARANELGMAVVITDHHLTTTENPDALAVVNPNQLGCSFASKSLVGVGVAFYVMGALCKRRRELGKHSTQVSRYLDLVALGTVADIGILDKNNRILVNAGLNLIKKGQCSLGILAILGQAGKQVHEVTAADFGFIIAPRINAAGRMDNMRVGIECLLADDWQRAARLADTLDELNKTRRAVEQQMKQTAEALLDALALDADPPDTASTDNPDTAHAASNSTNPARAKLGARSVVLYQDDWHQGVIGIVAGRIKERLYRPTVIFAPNDPNALGDDDLIKGSARSITGIHIRDVILQVAETHPDLICHFGGHAMAAGLTLHKRNFAAFAAAFETALDSFDAAVFSETKYSDGALSPSDVSLSFADTLKHLTIWGHGFLPPMFDGVFSVQQARILKDKHLKLALRMAGVQYPIDAIWFNYDARRWDYRASTVHVLFELAINDYQGNQSIQFLVRDLAVVALS